MRHRKSSQKEEKSVIEKNTIFSDIFSKDENHWIKYRWLRRLCKVVLGPLVGILIALFFFQKNDVAGATKLFWENNVPIELKNIKGISVDMIDQISMYLKPPFIETEISDMQPGALASRMGMKAFYPILLIPGIVSSGIELWKGRPCVKDSHFRKRLWGTMTMIKFMFLDRECWIEHLMLNSTDGMDPDGIKLRAAQGLEGADFLLPGYWVWGKMIENLASVGYDHNNLAMATYDWRLAIENLEKRDGYFTRLVRLIEGLKEANRRKIVIVAHSMGSNVVLYFLKWVQVKKGTHWIDEHIQVFTSVGGPFLGVPKSVSSIISGEMKDTALLGRSESFVLELLLSRAQRSSLFRSWGSLFSMLPKGDEIDSKIRQHDKTFVVKLANGDQLDASKANDLVFSLLKQEERRILQNQYNYDFTIDGNLSLKHWTNPLVTPLPNVSSLEIYCLYGIGKETERGYFYTDSPTDNPLTINSTLIKDSMLSEFYNSTDKTPLFINISHQDSLNNVVNGVLFTDGDGTVPLVSLGYMPFKGWLNPKLNPGGIKVVTREYRHEPVSIVLNMRGGPNTGDHVDILGNHQLTHDILRIVTNYDSLPEERILSNISNL